MEKKIEGTLMVFIFDCKRMKKFKYKRNWNLFIHYREEERRADE